MRTITRADAKALGLKRYFTGKPCKHGHVAERVTSSTACVICNRAACRAYKSKLGPERVRAAWQKQRLANLEKARARCREGNRARRLADPEKVHASERKYAAKWKSANLEKARATARKGTRAYRRRRALELAFYQLANPKGPFYETPID